ncbi:unnamed protein product [Miscanthus lutarioriparius]|uniref:Uncharacterized protein n=1 Tax=Miscanthus lutarioriparius TaxID=422564 RepID=A0A811QC92_9POAL|nr:unnamed protein product [Miscanthus lutarioriparius]
MAASNSEATSIGQGQKVPGFAKLQGSVPIKLNSQDLIEIAGIKFYFLLPSRSIFATLADRDTTSLPPQSSSLLHPADYPGHPSANDCGRSNGDNGAKIINDRQGKLVKQNRSFSGELDISNCYGISNADPVGTLEGCVSKLDISAEKEIDNQQLLLEEKDAATCLAALISDLSGPKGAYGKTPFRVVAVAAIVCFLNVRFGKNWPHDRVSRYLPQKGMSGSSTEADGRPWCSLWTLFKKYPEHFVMSTVTRGQAISEFVGLKFFDPQFPDVQSITKTTIKDPAFFLANCP